MTDDQQSRVIATTLSLEGREDWQELVSQALEAGVKNWHVDICSEEFCGRSAGKKQFIRCLCKLIPREHALDAHLMVNNPGNYYDLLSSQRFSHATLHVETPMPASQVVQYGVRTFSTGLAVREETGLEVLEEAIDRLRSTQSLSHLKHVLFLTSQTGTTGRGFSERALQKIRTFCGWMEGNDDLGHIRLAVDGGIHPKTAAACHSAGARDFFCGSWIFHGTRGPKEEPAGGTIAQRFREMVNTVSLI